MGLVLLLGADDSLLDVAELLREEGHETRHARDLSGDFATLCERTPDLILLDTAHGIEACRQLRLNPLTARIPLLVVAPPAADSNEFVLGLRPGLDGYVKDAVQPAKLVARARELLERNRQGGGWHDERIITTGVTIDPARYEVLVEGRPVKFTATEFRLLHGLAAHPGRVFTRAQLLRWVQGGDAVVMERTIDAHVRSIRKKLGAHRTLVETVRGVGYRFADDGRGGAGGGALAWTAARGQVPEARHCIVAGILPAGVFLLERETSYTVGRAHSCDLVLPHRSVSRIHAEVLWSSEGFTLQDRSTNGMRVNQTKLVGERALENGDVIDIGPFSLRFREFSDVNEILSDIQLEEGRTTPVPRSLPTQARMTHFRDATLIQICQLFSVRRQDGMLEIRGPGASGVIEFLAGIIVSARCGTLAGDEAVAELLAQREGSFRFRPRGEEATTYSGEDNARTDSLVSIFEAQQRTHDLLRDLERRARD